MKARELCLLGEDYGFKTIGEAANYIKAHKSIFNLREENKELLELKTELKKYKLKPEFKIQDCLVIIQNQKNK